VKNVRSLYVAGKVDGHEVDLLLDTGADMTLVSKNFLKTLKGDKQKWEVDKMKIHPADGNPIQARGPVPTKIELCGASVETQALAVDIVDPVILGLPALQKLNPIVDLANHELRISNYHIPCQDKIAIGMPQVKRLMTVRNGIFSPWRERLVTAKIKDECQTELLPWFIDDPGGTMKSNIDDLNEL
jgi:hypothetical protein